jgi:DNA-binding LacI/PurR family transcriptional regulator
MVAHPGKNLTEQVRERLVLEILNGKYRPGDRLPAERDLAFITRTSRVTVRRAYAQLARGGIITRQTRTGTRIANRFQGNTDEIQFIAVLTTLQDPFSRDFLEAVQKSCNEKDIFTILAVTDEDVQAQEKMAVKMVARGVKNIIVWGFDQSLNMATFARLRVLGVNLVFFDRVIPGNFADFVGLDNRHALQCLIAQAIKMKLQHLLFINIKELKVDSNRERQEYFIKNCHLKTLAYSLYELPWNKKDLRLMAAQVKSIASAQAGKAYGVVAVNDPVACQIQPFFPKGTPFYSIDGTPEAVTAGINTYSQPIQKMAEAAVRALEQQCRQGSKWQARQYRFKGGLLDR